MFRLLFTASGWVMLGVIVIGIGVVLLRDGITRTLPVRSELQPVAGVVQHVTKVTNTTKNGKPLNVTYELDVRTNDGQDVKLNVPEAKVNEAMARMLPKMPITALLRGSMGGVWELRAGNTTLLEYEKERALFAEGLASEARNGPYVIAGGFLVLIAGIYRLYRRR